MAGEITCAGKPDTIVQELPYFPARHFQRGRALNGNQLPSKKKVEYDGVRAAMLFTDTTAQNIDRLRDVIKTGIVKAGVGSRYLLTDAGTA